MVAGTMSRIEQRRHDRSDVAQLMNGSSRGESVDGKDSGNFSSSSRVRTSFAKAATILCADEKTVIADCNIVDDKQFMEGSCRNSKRKGTFLQSCCHVSEISDKFVESETVFCGRKGDFLNADGRMKKLAKTDTCLSKAEIRLFKSNLISAKEKHNDADGGVEFTSSSKTEDAEDMNGGEEHGRMQNEMFSLSPSAMNMHQACRSIHEFQRVSKIGEGVYGVVFKAQDKKTGEVVAIKRVKMEHEKEGFPITSLREINILLSMNHPSIVVVKEITVDKNLESVYMVMEHIEQDLSGLLATRKGSFSQSEVKFMMRQLLEGIEYVHSKWVLHRDLKPSNVLVDSQGMLKICDFGLARLFGSPLKGYTQKVVSLWYRDPALLLGSCKYATAVDMWSLGCIMAELLGKVPLFKGSSELDQLKEIVAVIGSPDESVLKDKSCGVQFNFLQEPSKSRLRERFPPTSFTGKTPLSEKGYDLLSRLLMYDPNKRISAEDAVRHGWFREDPLPKPLT